ncbi:ARF GTPase activator (Csx2), putative [Talaromyces stipitatus ATCC 10500]|uniref:ADP-ribosylation factor GTPase-activating protein n=1 Tax=Talaromyces stipitatus (strain ATCC 10500 / CBS 375.48 / QM 6759 / NRRL 1006) TaxID=441959 RepID=B8LZH4_TALSN|nr:ARF GTPase activator (Csx2), putative [Talaromyces stipitatus ATCC 10500]EED21727.1 ARF GTPase activator (Csx2), putative [Talaromyces stipitatus ATCC 10500]
MGTVSSKIDDSGTLFFKDQNRFAIANITVLNSHGRALLHITPNAFPASRYIAARDSGDDSPVEYVQDPDPPQSTSIPSFLLRLNNDEELSFKFTFIIRQTQSGQVYNSNINGVATSLPETTDTNLMGLTFAHASNIKELDNLITREFHANPNLQNNSNVQLVGDFSTSGSPSVQFEWTWKWKPPKAVEDKGGGWRNSCSFLDYDQRTNRLNTLANLTFWIQNTSRPGSSPQLMSPPHLDIGYPSRNRVPSSQSALSHSSDTEGPFGVAGQTVNHGELAIPNPPSSSSSIPVPNTPAPVKVDLPSRQGEDMSAVEDGPLFRATMKALEQKTGSMRTKIKKVLKKAEAAHVAQLACNDAVNAFISALNDASTSNANAIQPAMEHYFEKIAREILKYEQLNAVQLQKLVIEPLTKLYQNDIKQAESKKKDFDEESRDYYAYVGRYLGQRQDSLKEKKRVESDSKYQTKRRNFELKRFDYSSFMQDLHGGRKEQEVLSHLTKYAETQARNYLSTAKKVEDMLPQLEALVREVDQADKEFQFKRTEREEKRRALEKSSKTYVEPDSASTSAAIGAVNSAQQPETELNRADSTGSQLRNVHSNASSVSSQTAQSPGQVGLTSSLSNASSTGGANRFKGIRDLEERDSSSVSGPDKQGGPQRKEGLLWALSRPGSHIDPKGINKQAWHKFWIVLDQGKLSEYSNWKQRLDLHIEPIDLRMASVREARNAERRFCFEVITPQYKRIYQATSEEDMSNWITAINNALQSAVEGQSAPPSMPPPSSHSESNSIRRDIGSILTGKSSSYSGQHSYSTTTSANANSVNRRTTVGARPSYIRSDSHSYEENPGKLLQTIRDADHGNKWCADCGSTLKVEWVSINLGIVLCIECSGIHRSLGTHISKIRSLTLDVNSFSNDIVEILLQIGNRVSNMIWEATLDQSLKPQPQSSREQRLKFITAKYAEHAYVQPLVAGLSHYSTPNETLLASIKKNDIQGVLYGIALRANVNATDRSRNTHTVFLALAAADPATPGSTSPGFSPVSTAKQAPPKPIPFPIAELLVQNGAEIPQQPAPILLSPAAQLYISQRTATISGSIPPSTSTAIINNNIPSSGRSTADTLSSLPLIRGGSNSEAHSAAHALAPLDSKEREKLQKRGSAGARFAGKVSSLGVDK